MKYVLHCEKLDCEISSRYLNSWNLIFHVQYLRFKCLLTLANTLIHACKSPLICHGLFRYDELLSKFYCLVCERVVRKNDFLDSVGVFEVRRIHMSFASHKPLVVIFVREEQS